MYVIPQKPIPVSSFLEWFIYPAKRYGGRQERKTFIMSYTRSPRHMKTTVVWWEPSLNHGRLSSLLSKSSLPQNLRVVRQGHRSGLQPRASVGHIAQHSLARTRHKRSRWHVILLVLIWPILQYRAGLCSSGVHEQFETLSLVQSSSSLLASVRTYIRDYVCIVLLVRVHTYVRVHAHDGQVQRRAHRRRRRLTIRTYRLLDSPPQPATMYYYTPVALQSGSRWRQWWRRRRRLTHSRTEHYRSEQLVTAKAGRSSLLLRLLLAAAEQQAAASMRRRRRQPLCGICGGGGGDGDACSLSRRSLRRED